MEKKYYYKVMNKDMQCRGFQFKVGETYTIESKALRLNSNKVFHFCEELESTIDYYDSSTDRHFLIEALGNIITDYEKSGSNKIRIVREITRDEIEGHIQNKDSFNAKLFLALYSTNINILGELAKENNREICKKLAKNPNIPVYILEILSKDIDIRFFVAKNPNTPAYLLEELAKDVDRNVRVAVAENTNTPVYILEELEKDEDSFVRRAVAENPNTPVYILEELFKGEELFVLYVIAKNPNIPVYLLKELAKNEYYRIRLAVATNLNTPIYILKELAKDEIQYVREEAQRRLKEITQ